MACCDSRTRRVIRLLFVIWLVAGGAFLALLARERWVSMQADLETHTLQLAGNLAQRVDQHDAHLTGLAAAVQAGKQPDAEIFHAVADAVRAFYPRVVAIYLQREPEGGGITVSPAMAVVVEHSGESTALDALPVTLPDLASALHAAGNHSQVISVFPVPQAAHYYLLVKKFPTDASVQQRLVLLIDADRLLGELDEFWRQPGRTLRLQLPDDSIVIQTATADSDPEEVVVPWSSRIINWSGRPLVHSATLNSRTQPLRLSATWSPMPGELLPWLPALIGLLTLGLVTAAAGIVINARTATLAAERRARLGEQEARIAHASRVNALGEVASGIVHELTQPLTAMLSQSQAAKRLLGQSEGHVDDTWRTTLAELMLANEVQAKRAAGLLSRFREWIKPTMDSRIEPIDVNAAIDNVLFLLDARIKALAASLVFEADRSVPMVEGDPVQLEQILFNLLQNALDKKVSASGGILQIRVRTRIEMPCVCISVYDNGHAVSHDVLDHATEPFVTGKIDGLGLGLALVERLVSRMRGQFHLENGMEGGVVASISLPGKARPVLL